MTILKLIALGLTALILIPSGSHLFELPGRIDLDREAYFTVQMAASRSYGLWQAYPN